MDEAVPDVDPDYDPTDDEINDYAEYLEMDIQKYPQLRYLAREGVKVLIIFNITYRHHYLLHGKGLNHKKVEMFTIIMRPLEKVFGNIHVMNYIVKNILKRKKR